jgi:ABC-type multidrug transport system ATPase subunit
LAKDYGDRPALAPLDVTVEDGQAVALVGHNGSGKTTFLRIASGLLEPTAGTVEVHGHPAGSLGARSAVAYLSDAPTFYEDLSVWEHLEYVARLHGHDDWEQDAADLLGHVGLYERADELPTRFSRGMRQKATIALAFIRPFEVLLVDEPFVGLDRTGRDALLELFGRVHADGAALVVATHELTTVGASERLVALRDGVVVYDGSPRGADVDALVAR